MRVIFYVEEFKILAPNCFEKNCKDTYDWNCNYNYEQKCGIIVTIAILITMVIIMIFQNFLFCDSENLTKL